MSTAQVRQIASAVLAKHGKTNNVKAKTTNFDCSRFRSNYILVTIQGWTPDPSAEGIDKDIKAEGNNQGIGIMVEFTGTGFIQG